MKRIQLRTKDANKLLENYHLSLQKKDQIELLEDKFKVIIINKIPAFFYYQELIVPTLKYLQQYHLLKKITIDAGAIKFIISGADVMRPGIVDLEPEIEPKELVVIIDKDNQKPLAVGIALYSGIIIKSMLQGKVIKNIHYVGDTIWRFTL